MTDWNAIYDLVATQAGPDVRVPTANRLRDLVQLYGWDALGAILSFVNTEADLRTLVRAGVPFDDAVKVTWPRGCSRAAYDARDDDG